MSYDGNESNKIKTGSPLAPKPDNSWVKLIPEYQTPVFKSGSCGRKASDLCGVDQMKKLKTPPELDRIVDRVLAFRPKATNPKQKKRKRKVRKLAKQ